MRRLQDELALESVTNIEFEEASRRSFDFLNEQVQILKEAFNKLTASMVEEVESMGGKFDKRLAALAQMQASQGRSSDLPLYYPTSPSSQLAMQPSMSCPQFAATSMDELMRNVLPVVDELVMKRLNEKLGAWPSMNSKMGELSEQISQINAKFVDVSRKHREFQEKLVVQEKFNEKLVAQDKATNERVLRLEKYASEASLHSIEKSTGRLDKLETLVDQSARDVDAVLCVIPKLEDKVDGVSTEIHRLSESTKASLERLDDGGVFVSNVAEDISERRVAAMASQLEARFESLLSREAADLREDMEQKHLKLQRSVTRQMESISKVLAEPQATPFSSRRSVGMMDSEVPPSPAFSAQQPFSPIVSRAMGVRSVRLPA